MQEVTKIVRNTSGIHARPAGIFINEAKNYQSAITITNLDTGKSADAKSILRLMTLCLTNGTLIRITAEGEDEREALEALGALIDGGLGEDL